MKLKIAKSVFTLLSMKKSSYTLEKLQGLEVLVRAMQKDILILLMPFLNKATNYTFPNFKMMSGNIFVILRRKSL